MLQIITNGIVLVAVVYLMFLYRKVISPFTEKYSEEKGKRLATHEDFEQILDELRRTTESVEKIRSQIETDAWTRQRVWEQKRDAYFKILKSCLALSETLSNYVGLRRTNFMVARERGYSKELAEKQRGGEWKIGGNFLKQIHEVNQEFNEAFIFLSDGVGLLFDEYTNERSNFLSLVSTEQYEEGEEAAHERIMDGLNFLERWRGRLVDFAKIDLGVTSSGTSTHEPAKP